MLVYTAGNKKRGHLFMKIAVYGTLKAGFGNSRVIAGATFLGYGKTLPQFTMVDLGAFPGVVHTGDTEVSIEVYEVENIRGVDNLEGNGVFYTREEHFVDVDGELMEVWIYILPDSYLDTNPVIDSGVW